MKERDSHGILSLQTLNVPSECKVKPVLGQEFDRNEPEARVKKTNVEE